MKIVIYTRSMNYDLFKLSSQSVTLNYERKRCNFTSADGYFYDHIVKSDADFIINLDEDAFITDNHRLQQLLEFVIDNDYVNCGMADGGVVAIRKHNPLVTNPFFNILNVKKIKEQFDLQHILKNYSTHKASYEKHAPQALLKNKYEYDFFEPYNSFFIWLSVNFKTLYLDAEEHADGISTILKDHLGVPFLYHSWYSRFYGEDDKHTQRIDNLYKEATGKELPPKDLKGELIKLKDQLGRKYYFPLKLRVQNKLR